MEFTEYGREMKTRGFSNYTVLPMEFQIDIYLDTYLTVLKRTRYNVWDLLGDVGGFNDGLNLVASLIFSFYSTFAFSKDLINSTHIDGDKKSLKNKSTKALENPQRYQATANMIRNSGPESKFILDASKVPIFKRGLNQAKLLKHSIYLALKETFLCANKKERKLKERLMNRIDKSLDIRNIIESQAILLTLLRRTMNKQQRKLFHYQRDRLLAPADSSNSSSDSSLIIKNKFSQERLS